ncbi:MAG: hypothetical protein JXR73_21875 [Candidatus Omnitrophica bacterium]|nr:hypothetical protein [Candidatus Omnitrophota bacterium]
MLKKTKAGLLPLYLKLYDDAMPEIRAQFEPFLQTVVDGLSQAGIEVMRGEVCRLRSEFQNEIRRFEENSADILIALHLAYSLSLEAIDAFAAASIPILLLDATMDAAFGQDADPARLMFNHGVHGVQDLASVMKQRKIPFHITAGHVTESNVLQRAAGISRAACAARRLSGMKLLRIGGAFAGMGDFSVDDALLQDRFGASIDSVGPEILADDIQAISNDEIEEEMQHDLAEYQAGVDPDVHRRSVKVGLGLRRYLDRGGYGAFSMNFLSFDSAAGPVDTVPFLEISKAMSRGFGYAGEGDVLTAMLVGALNQTFGKTTFTEIFCPDWKHGTLFLSHMGEINPALSAKRPVLCEKDFPWTNACNPAFLACAPAPGGAVLVNLAPGPDHTFHLIIAPVEILEDAGNPAWQESIRCWIRPPKPLERFLEEYSLQGGTHHSALTAGDWVEAIDAFASFLGMERTILSA